MPWSDLNFNIYHLYISIIPTEKQTFIIFYLVSHLTVYSMKHLQYASHDLIMLLPRTNYSVCQITFYWKENKYWGVWQPLINNNSLVTVCAVFNLIQVPLSKSPSSRSYTTFINKSEHPRSVGPCQPSRLPMCSWATSWLLNTMVSFNKQQSYSNQMNKKNPRDLFEVVIQRKPTTPRTQCPQPQRP